MAIAVNLGLACFSHASLGLIAANTTFAFTNFSTITFSVELTCSQDLEAWTRGLDKEIL